MSRWSQYHYQSHTRWGHPLLLQTNIHTYLGEKRWFYSGRKTYLCVLFDETSACLLITAKTTKHSATWAERTLEWEMRHNMNFTLCALGCHCLKSDQTEHIWKAGHRMTKREQNHWRNNENKIRQNSKNDKKVFFGFFCSIHSSTSSIPFTFLPSFLFMYFPAERNFQRDCYTMSACTNIGTASRTDSSSPAMRLDGLFVVTRTAIST